MRGRQGECDGMEEGEYERNDEVGGGGGGDYLCLSNPRNGF